MRAMSAVLAGAMLVAACAEAQDAQSNAGALAVERVAEGLEHPWGLAFLPDGRMLVTERPGRLRIVGSDGSLSQPLRGVPEVFAQGQGGLLDVALDPDFESNRLVYLSYSEAGRGGASTAVARGQLGEAGLEQTQVIFRVEPKTRGGQHFGSRLVFAPDGMLFVTLGDRGRFDPSQDLADHNGSVIRIAPDGAVPADNPFVGRSGVRPEIWSYGHRNIQGAAIHPATGALWLNEHGPRGGDEINVPQPGQNYGWPLVSWGNHYDGRRIPDPPTRPDLVPPVHHWTPGIAPSGMAFYTGDLLPQWRGSILVGGLTARAVVRLSVDGQSVREEERIGLDARVRDVRQGPDGAVYVLTDHENGAILRLRPAQ